MKTNICKLNGEKKGFSKVLEEVDKCAAYNGLAEKQKLHLTLLAEEMIGMLPELLKKYEGEFWIENDGEEYELHAVVISAGYDREERENVLALSKSGKNVATVGFMGKIRAIADAMMLSLTEESGNTANSLMNSYMMELGMGYNMNLTYSSNWTLNHYKNTLKQKSEETKEQWDELEKSIVAKLADDVIVGVDGRKVDIVVKKTFKMVE